MMRLEVYEESGQWYWRGVRGDDAKSVICTSPSFANVEDADWDVRNVRDNFAGAQIERVAPKPKAKASSKATAEKAPE